ncbi:uncharacterized protein EHS24_000080 [Apiotrichum porosum]|uniref:Uncharacterized protein n=1 Tax=Apiotrichum porosum TaxID=105984 RepID=A0A427Y8V9_9TREE|nr:uncharacterized protein EHS24_000080 [Apiotrichum porosum]RSH87570.1 hypothetical protein EHS24_000080 [Apiotrichum porosum]
MARRRSDSVSVFSFEDDVGDSSVWCCFGGGKRPKTTTTPQTSQVVYNPPPTGMRNASGSPPALPQKDEGAIQAQTQVRYAPAVSPSPSPPH